MTKTESKTGYSYATIKITKSRIDKGLLALPITLMDWFPRKNSRIKVFFGDSSIPEVKTYTSYHSKSHESRIGGLAEWFGRNKIREGDEVVVQIIDKKNFIYRLTPETEFVKQIRKIQDKFDTASDEKEVSETISEIAKWADTDRTSVGLTEFHRLAQGSNIVYDRKRFIRKTTDVRENVPVNIKTLLGEIYQGHCQVCDFWFLKRDRTPYYEIHHINPVLGNSLKNLLLVCGNCHNQFTYAYVKEKFREGWLSKVIFNNTKFVVNQIIFKVDFHKPVKQIFE